MKRFSLFGLLPLCLALGCQEYDEPELTPAQQQKVAAQFLTQAPTPQIPVGAELEGKIRILGYDIDKTSAAPGSSVTVTWYIESLCDQSENLMMFVHLQGRKGEESAWMNLDHHLVEGLLPLRTLKKGQIVKDVQKVTVKSDFEPGQAHFYYGIFRGSHRLTIDNPNAVLHDEEGRLIGPKLKILRAPERPLPTAFATRLQSDEQMSIDGQLTEPVWQRARETDRFTAPDGSGKSAPYTRARFAWDDQNLYVAVVAVDDDIWSSFTERDSNIWEEEVIELFIDANGDRKDYVELQVTPANVVFDAMFTRYRSDLETARKWNLQGFETAIQVDGTLNNRDDKDEKYTVEMKIPFASLPDMQLPVKPLSEIKFNMFRFDKPKRGRQVAGAFSPPIRPDFHTLNRFGNLKFLDPAVKSDSPDNGNAAKEAAVANPDDGLTPPRDPHVLPAAPAAPANATPKQLPEEATHKLKQ